jgi:hypothetical protein
MCAVPDVGGNNVVSILIAVVFPAPFGPNNPNTSPGANEIVISSTAVSPPNLRVSASVSKIVINLPHALFQS